LGYVTIGEVEKMTKKKGSLCYAPLVQKIKEIDIAIEDMKLKIEKIKGAFREESAEPEICLDEIESELAVMRVFQNVYFETMADEDPEGEA
jgi:hypothetical protein